MRLLSYAFLSFFLLPFGEGSVAFAQLDRAKLAVDSIAMEPASPAGADIHWVDKTLNYFTHANTPEPNPCATAQPVSAAAQPKAGCVQPADPNAKPHFSKPDEFIDYMVSLALPITHKSHFPVSVLIAQALLETGGGKTDGYLKRNSFFGLSCFDQGALLDYSISVKGESVQAQGKCSTPRPSRERGYYVVFAHPVDSVVAYVYTLLQSPRTSFYATIRQKIAKISGSDAVLSHQEALAAMSKYNPNPAKYRALLEGIIKMYHLDRYDHAEPCQ